VIYKPQLSRRALGKLGGFPTDALDALGQSVARICEDPYDPLTSLPTGPEPRDRWAVLADAGFIEFYIDDDAHLVIVDDITWTG
jgi:hypothetical protein